MFTLDFFKKKLEKAVSKRDGKKYLEAIYYNKEENRLEACDGTKLACLPVQDAVGDESGFIPVEAWTHARKVKADSMQVSAASVKVTSGTGEGDDVITEFKTGSFENLWYPDVSQVLKPVLPEFGQEPTMVLSVKALYELAQALCDDQEMVLEFFVKQSPNGGPTYNPVFVQENAKPKNEQGFVAKAYGVMMPRAR